VTNVTINIANVKSLFGLGTVADPLTAHTGYGEDERVGGLMARGAGHADGLSNLKYGNWDFR
jgi:hypothetical protein